MTFSLFSGMLAAFAVLSGGSVFLVGRDAVRGSVTDLWAKSSRGELGCDWTKPRPPDISDRYARFYNSVVAELRKTEPAARVVGYAYANYSGGPKRTKMSPGVTIEYVPRNFSESVKYEDYVKIGWKNRCSKLYPAGGHNRFANVVHDLYPDSFFVDAAEILSAAARAAKGDDGAARRVAFLRKGLEDARLTRVAVARHVAWAADRTDERRAAFDAAFRELLDYRALIEADDVANYDCFARAESAGLGWKFNYGK